MLAQPAIFYFNAKPGDDSVRVAEVRHNHREVVDRPVVKPGGSQWFDIALGHPARLEREFLRITRQRDLTRR